MTSPHTCTCGAPVDYSGRGRPPLCPACTEARKPSTRKLGRPRKSTAPKQRWTVKPCRRCGGPKPPGKRRQICDACASTCPTCRSSEHVKNGDCPTYRKEHRAKNPGGA